MNSPDPSNYLGKMKDLFENLRNDLGLPQLPVIAGQVNNEPDINSQIAKLPDNLPAMGFARSDGLTAMDRWHFDAKSMKLLGERYAEEMLKIQTQPND